MKTLFLILLVSAAACLAACESNAAPQAAQPPGPALGDSNIHVSGSVDAGGTLRAH